LHALAACCLYLQGAEALRRLQDVCLEAEERADAAERRVAVLEAR
jgi:hypothetical protein